MTTSTAIQFPTTAAQSAAGSTTVPAAAKASATTLGGTDFLTLMLAQLKNQDPTSPVDSNTFLTQLSELSEVQGITQLNTSFGGLSSSLVASQAMQASSVLGHQALVASSTATLASAGAAVAGGVSVPQNTSAVTVNIFDSSGAVVKQIALGAQSTGIANFSWDGKETSGAKAPPGTYTLGAQIAGVASGTAIPTYVSGTVQSVTMGAGTTGLSLNVAGVGTVPFANVEQISP